MTRVAAIAAVIAALCAAALLPAAGAGAAHVLAPGCGGKDKAAYKPDRITIACGDGNLFVKDASWSSWGSKSAAGTATARQNTCTPNCAMGKFKSYAVKLKLSHPKACAHSLTEFSELTYTFTGKRPKGAPKSSSVPRPCSS